MTRFEGIETYDELPAAVYRSGKTGWGELTVVPFNWESKPASSITLRDISQQKKVEAQLLHSRKMESTGTLAGGIAHGFNNLPIGMLHRLLTRQRIAEKQRTGHNASAVPPPLGRDGFIKVPVTRAFVN